MEKRHRTSSPLSTFLWLWFHTHTHTHTHTPSNNNISKLAVRKTSHRIRTDVLKFIFRCHASGIEAFCWQPIIDVQDHWSRSRESLEKTWLTFPTTFLQQSQLSLFSNWQTEASHFLRQHTTPNRFGIGISRKNAHHYCHQQQIHIWIRGGLLNICAGLWIAT